MGRTCRSRGRLVLHARRTLFGTGTGSVEVRLAERNGISGLLAFIGREAGWDERLQSVIDEHLDAALAECQKPMPVLMWR